MNEDGSCWTLTIPKAGEERVLNAFWLDAMLACVGEMLEDSSEVCGLKSPFGHCGMSGLTPSLLVCAKTKPTKLH